MGMKVEVYHSLTEGEIVYIMKQIPFPTVYSLLSTYMSGESKLRGYGRTRVRGRSLRESDASRLACVPAVGRPSGSHFHHPSRAAKGKALRVRTVHASCKKAWHLL